jgi:hypothetical protein
MKYTRIAAAALVIASSLGTAGHAGAKDHAGWKIVHHHGVASGGTFTDLGSVCDSAGQCVTVSDAVDVFLGGDDNGLATQGISAVTSNTGVFVLTALSTFVGTERSCGTGTIVYTLVGTADFNKSSIMYFTADLVPGTGTGDFTGMTGHLVGSTDLADPNSPSITEGIERCHR